MMQKNETSLFSGKVRSILINIWHCFSDTFTDTGISKYNGEVEKEMRDLQPWESEGGLDVSLEDGDKASVSIDLQGVKWTPDAIWNKMLFTI